MSNALREIIARAIPWSIFNRLRNMVVQRLEESLENGGATCDQSWAEFRDDEIFKLSVASYDSRVWYQSLLWLNKLREQCYR